MPRKSSDNIYMAFSTFTAGSDFVMRTTTTAAISGSVTCAALLYFLGHRTDYVGHYAAGFGGTLFALAIGVGLIPKKVEPATLTQIAFCISIASIALGGLFEASINRLAIFDPVDFCNQSIGALIATLAFLAAPPRLPLAGGEVVLLSITSVVFLILGFFWAFN